MKFCCFVALLLMFCCSNLCSQAVRQQVNLPVTEKDFALPGGTVASPNDAGVILSDIGTLGFAGSKDRNWISCIWTRKTRIKIINKAAFELATVKIQLLGDDKLDSLEAITYNLENGKLTQSKLEQKDRFENKLGSYVTEIKFTMPDIKEGSVIEYSSSISSYRFYDLPGWNFQHTDYPCLYSSIQLSVPDLLRYTIVEKGLDTAVVTQLASERKVLRLANVDVATDIHPHRWEMRNIAAFKETAFIHAARDYTSKIEFYLAQTYNGESVQSMNTWATAGGRLLATRRFGTAITAENAGNLYNTAEKLTATAGNPMEAAKNIYNYVRNNFSSTGDGDIYLGRDLYEINKSRKGSVAELNLLLVALLRQKELKADPVILSTRSNGAVPADYPVTDKMNYVLCQLKMYGDTIYLDASEPLLGFGKLPVDCYNGAARVVGEKDTGNVLLQPELLNELKSTTVFLENDENGKGMSGNYQSVPGYHQSYEIRKSIKKTGLSGYFKQAANTDAIEINNQNAAVDSLDRLEDPVKIHYDFKWTVANSNDGIVYFTPILFDAYKQNPFGAADRKYPIELEKPIDELFVLNMEIPRGYAIDELPRSAKVAFNGDEGFYEYIIQKDENGLQLRSRIKLKRAIYRAEEYDALRDFFAFIVKKQAEQVVFRKK